MSNGGGERMGEDEVLVLVEIPKGSRNKYELDHETGRFFLDRMLFSSVQYPGDYGFIPDTLAEDGDALDVLVLLGEPTFSGCMIRCRPVGLFHMADEKGPDEKVLCVPIRDPQWNWIRDLGDVPPHLLDEIRHFFKVYKDLESKETTVGGWEGAEAARERVAAARRHHAERAR